MKNALTELMDEWCAKYESCPQATQAAREAYRIIKDCKTVMIGMQYEIDAINESAAGHIQKLQSEKKQLFDDIKKLSREGGYDVDEIDGVLDKYTSRHPSVQPSLSRKWRAMSERIDAGESEASVMYDYGLIPSR